MRRLTVFFIMVLLTSLSCGGERSGSESGVVPASENSAPADSSESTPPIPEKGLIKAGPNPIKVCDGSRLGTTTLSWTAEGGQIAEVRVGKPDGALFATSNGPGSAETGKWVREGLDFYLLINGNTVDRVAAHLSTENCGASSTTR